MSNLKYYSHLTTRTFFVPFQVIFLSFKCVRFIVRFLPLPWNIFHCSKKSANNSYVHTGMRQIDKLLTSFNIILQILIHLLVFSLFWAVYFRLRSFVAPLRKHSEVNELFFERFHMDTRTSFDDSQNKVLWHENCFKNINSDVLCTFKRDTLSWETRILHSVTLY